MGQNESKSKIPLRKKDPSILYRIDFQGGFMGPIYKDETLPQIHGEGVFSEPGTISIEVLLNCERGDIGPISINNLKSEETRRIELWHANMGLPIYCIVVMYRGEKCFFPEWTVRNCMIEMTEGKNRFNIGFRHLQKIMGGDAVVYSITMASFYQRHSVLASPSDPLSLV